MENDSPLHLSSNLHVNLKIKMPKRKLRSEMGLLNTPQMTFLRRHGFTAIALTMLITVVVTEWAVLFRGFLHMDANFNFGITFERRVALQI